MLIVYHMYHMVSYIIKIVRNKLKDFIFGANNANMVDIMQKWRNGLINNNTVHQGVVINV